MSDTLGRPGNWRFWTGGVVAALALVCSIAGCGASSKPAAPATASPTSTSTAASTPSVAAPSSSETAAGWKAFRTASEHIGGHLPSLNTSNLTLEVCKNFAHVVQDIKQLPDSPSTTVDQAFDTYAADIEVIANNCADIVNGTATSSEVADTKQAINKEPQDVEAVRTALQNANAPADIQTLWLGVGG